jgi:hypothetical protein
MKKMKKSILIWAVLLLASTSFSFANPTDEVNGNVKTSFKKDFGNADGVKWENQKGFLIATFSLNGKITCAYYSKSGDLIAVTRNILSTQLPIRQLLSLEKNYKGYWITDLFEIDANEETSYFISLENADYKLVLKSDVVDGWNEYKKEKKE